MVEVKHDILEEKIKDIQEAKEMEEKIQGLVREKRQRSMLGFMEMDVPFQISLQFLEPKGIFKFLGLNKEIRSNFLSNMDCYSHI